MRLHTLTLMLVVFMMVCLNIAVARINAMNKEILESVKTFNKSFVVEIENRYPEGWHLEENQSDVRAQSYTGLK